MKESLDSFLKEQGKQFPKLISHFCSQLLQECLKIYAKCVTSVTSLKHNAEKSWVMQLECKINLKVRTHWHRENDLHWALDVHFKDDHDYRREKNSATHFEIVKKMGLNLLKKETTKKRRQKIDDKKDHKISTT